MKIGAKDADAYLAEWRKVPSGEVEGDQDDLARDIADPTSRVSSTRLSLIASSCS